MNSGHDLTYLLFASCLRRGWRCRLAIFSRVPPTTRQVPCEFHWDQPKLLWGYPWGVCLKGSWHDLAHLLWAALLPVKGWHPPAVLAAHLPTPLPTSPSSLVKIPALWFFQGWSPWGWYGGLPQHCTRNPWEAISHVPLKQGTCHILRAYVGGSLAFLCYCSDSCRQTMPNFGTSLCRNHLWDLFATLRDCKECKIREITGNQINMNCLIRCQFEMNEMNRFLTRSTSWK